MTRKFCSVSAVSLAMMAFARTAAAQDPTTPAADDARPVPPPPIPPSTQPAVTTTQPPPPPDLTLAPPTGPSVDDSGVGTDGHPLAGFHNGSFFLRDANDNFHMFINGRLQIDFFSYAGQGVADAGSNGGGGSALKPTLFFRRIRPELQGDFLHHFNFMIAGDFGATAIDNPKGTTQTSAAAPGAAPTATSGKYASAETTRFQAAAADVFINYSQCRCLNLQVGQFDAPFMMDNRTSDKYTPFMERALPVRAVGIPSNKEIGAMFWGETENRFFFYSVGPFNGDGQNRPNQDARFDVLGRFFVHPLALSDMSKDNPIRDMQIGGSFRYGSRDKKFVDYDYPAMTTQGAYAFWSPTYGGANGTQHIIPSGDQVNLAGELRIPIDRFDLTGELLYIKNNTREALEGYEASNSDRFGDIHGISYYAMADWWIFGKRDIQGLPGYENYPKLDWSKNDPKEPATALQALVKFEQVALHYDSSSRGGVSDTKNIDGAIKLNAFSLGLNYWATKHVRISLNYVYNQFPDSAPTSASATGGPVQTSSNRALAPGNTLSKGVNDGARDGAHELHEVLARFAIAL